MSYNCSKTNWVITLRVAVGAVRLSRRVRACCTALSPAPVFEVISQLCKILYCVKISQWWFDVFLRWIKMFTGLGKTSLSFQQGFENSPEFPSGFSFHLQPKFPHGFPPPKTTSLGDPPLNPRDFARWDPTPSPAGLVCTLMTHWYKLRWKTKPIRLASKSTSIRLLAGPPRTKCPSTKQSAM